MKLVFYKTKDPTLRQYLEGYYFIFEDNNTNVIRYKTFPNNYIIIAVSQNADVIYQGNNVMVVPSLTPKITTDLYLRYNNPLDVVYEKAINEITFYFKPLGLNHFIPDTDILSRHKSLNDFLLFPDMNARMGEIFEMENPEQQIEAIEAYWLSKLQVKDLSLMEKLLADIESTDLKIDEIAKTYNFSRQYVNKLFRKHIGKTPSEYRKIHRFRNAIKRKKEMKNLTKLSHNQLFYDQSHFNKDFRELTDSKPSFFFKNVDTEKENIWLFI